jgi:GTPase SAR1 family protein
MISVSKKVADITDKISPYLDTYLGEQLALELFDELNTRLKDSKLQIMLFGAYNAGKSSLINTLIGREVAPVADVPKTALVDCYDWNGCTLLDTPGLNAPIEHEELTTEQVNRSELILCVIREGDQDTKDVYRRLGELLKYKKSIFIVFNHQLAEELLEEALFKLNEQLLAIARDDSKLIMEIAQIKVIPININTALTAKAKGSKKLAEHSGLTTIEQEFDSWIIGFDNERGYLKQLKGYVEHCLITPLLNEFSVENKSEHTDLIARKQQLRASLVKEQNILISKLSNFIRDKTSKTKLDVESALNCGGSENAINLQMQDILSELLMDSSAFLSDCIDDIKIEGNSISSFTQTSRESESNDFVNNLSDTALSIAKNADHKAVTKELFLTLRGFKVPGLKGRWTKTFDKWAGKAAPVLQIGVSLLEMKLASDAEKAQNEKRRQQQLEFYKAVESGTQKLNDAVFGSCQSAIIDKFTLLIEGVTQDIETAVSEENTRVKDQEYISNLSDELTAITL